MHARKQGLPPSVRRPGDFPYLRKILIFELIENLKYANSITEAIHAWAKDDNTQDYALVVGKSMVEFGCNFANCSVRTVTPAFIRRSDFRMLYRAAADCMCVCIARVSNFDA